MIRRCHDEGQVSYKNYGAKGITVCSTWRESIYNFLNDMGHRPSEKHSIDRIDYTKGYYKENCRWSTIEEQANNKSSNVVVCYQGESLNLSQWSTKLGIKYTTLVGRFNQGYVDDALFSKEKLPHRCTKVVTFEGRTLSLSEWSSELSIPVRTLIDRYNRSLPSEGILRKSKT
jgi:hypothetical protein